MEISSVEQPWIDAGYALFAKEGPAALKVEVLARQVGKNKSSFYHLFADLEVFIDRLLDYHRLRAELIAEAEGQCKNVIPELLEVILQFKIDLLFNRQLRVHRDRPDFAATFEASNAEVAEAILGIWAEGLGLEGNSHLALLVLRLSLENFYLQITEKTLTYEWLESYIKQLQGMVQAFRQNAESLQGSM